jgi:subtilisin family serine protease
MAETAGIEWNISQVNAPAVWALGYTGQGAIVAGADTGYDWDHPALVGHYRGWDGTNANHNYNWHDAIHSGSSGCGVNSPAPCDGHWHGTHTMGTMVGDDGAANRIGMAPGARWIGTRNMNDSGAGTPATYSECFEWFIAPTDLNGQNPDPARAPDVINNSWGCPASEGCTSPDVLRTVVENTRAAGIVVVASAGNDGSGCSTINVPPSIYEAAFTVGATDGSDAAASFSSRGPVTVDGSGRRKPDVSAPGVSVRSSTPGTGYALSSGTSMAGPHVAGLVALVLSAHPGLKGQVDRIETLLEKTCRPRTTTQNCGTIPGTNVPNNTYGWGRIDALAAVGVNDSDGDGMPNWWEVIFGMDSTNAVDGAADSDCDGFSNAEEYLSNTDPTNASSRLRMSDISVTTAGVVTITWSSRQDGFDASRKYDVVRLAGGLGESNVWTVIASNVAAAGATTSVNDDSGGTATQWFYRVNIAGTGGVGAGMAGPSGR